MQPAEALVAKRARYRRTRSRGWVHHAAARNRVFVALALLAAALTPAMHAHHSFGGVYDPNRMLTLRGKVVEVRYMNPHIRIVIELIEGDGKPLRDARGSAVRWVGETMSIRVAQRRNFTRDSLRPGQVISLRGWESRKEGAREMGVSEIIQESGHVFVARERIEGGRRVPPAPYPGLLRRSR